MKHKIGPALAVCEICNLSCLAIYSEKPLLDSCPGYELMTDDRGFPTEIGDNFVMTEAGPCHRECFQGPIPPGSIIDADEALDLEAENERRRDMGDPPISFSDDC